MAEPFTLPFVRVGERLYVDLMALEVGCRDFADELAGQGQLEAADAIQGMCDDLWKSIRERGAAEQTNP